MRCRFILITKNISTQAQDIHKTMIEKKYNDLFIFSLTWISLAFPSLFHFFFLCLHLFYLFILFTFLVYIH